MENTKKLRKQLLAAIIMLLVAAVALGTSTYAWFVAQNTVTAEGMKVKAQAENGIVIKSKDVDSSVFASTASAQMTTATELFPTSTVDLANWYHAVSSNRDDEDSAQAEENYTQVAAGELNKYMVMKTFIIRTAAQEQAMVDSALAVKSVTATRATSTSENLDKAIRVGVKVGSQIYIYAPLRSGGFARTATYTTGSLNANQQATANSADKFPLTNDTIPANDTGVEAYVYMWFEGEDDDCKSTNITAALDAIDVSVVFEAVAK